MRRDRHTDARTYKSTRNGFIISLMLYHSYGTGNKKKTMMLSCIIKLKRVQGRITYVMQLESRKRRKNSNLIQVPIWWHCIQP